MSCPKWALALLLTTSTAIAVLSCRVFDWYFGPAPTFMVPFLLPVVVTAVLGGTRWGLVATVLNATALAWYFTAPDDNFRIAGFEDRMRLGGFFTVGAALSGFTGGVRRGWQRLARRNDELEREVAERREVERLLEIRVGERTAEIAAQNRLLDAVLDALPVAFIIADPAGAFVRVNRACYDLCGAVPLAGGVGDYPAWVGYWPGTGRRVEPMEWPLSRAVFRGESCTDQIEIERFGDRARRTLQISAAPVRGPDGTVIAGVVTGVDVTERQQVADALRESERKFRAVFHTQFQFIGLMSPDGVLLEANRTALLAAGVPEGAVLGKPFWETAWWTHDAAQQDRLREAVRRAAAGYPDRFEASHPRADGTLMWVDFSLTPYRDDGNVTLLIPEGRDITERKRAEAALRESEELLGSFFEAPGSLRGVVELVGGDIIHLRDNVEAAAFFGRTQDEMRNRRASEMGVSEDVIRFWSGHYRESRRSNRPVQFEFTVPGGGRWLQASVTPLDSQPAQRFSYVAWDVTDRKKAEEALRESERFARTVLDALPAHIAVVDGAGTITAVNRAWEQFASDNPAAGGVAARRGVGVSYLAVCDDNAALGCADARAAAAGIRRVLADGGTWTGVEYDCHAPRERRWFSMSVAPLSASAGGAVISHTNITSRRLAEETVRESEERFRGAFEFAPIGMALIATDGRWQRVNRQLCEIVGYAEAELLATDFQSVTHPDDLGTALELVRRALDGTTSHYQTEKRYVHKVGHPVEVLLAVSLVRDPANSPLYFVAQVKDISPRKQAERELAANTALLRQFIRHSPAAIAMFDREVRYVQASDRWLIDYHLEGRDIIGRSHYEVFPDIPDHWKAIHQRVLAGAVEACAEDPFPRADGTTEWLQWECRPWHDSDGRIGGLIMFTQVITARKRAEAVQQAIERRYRLVLDGAGLGSWDWDVPTGRVIFDARLTEMLGYRLDEFRPNAEEWTSRINPGDREAVMEAVNAHLDRRAPSYKTEHRLRHKDGHWIWVLDAGGVLEWDADGRAVRMCGIHMDVTDRKRAEEQALASLREKELLLKEIHHRVKNNLQIISALLHLQSASLPDRAVREMFDESRGRVKSMALIHERLYRSGDLAGVDLAEYVRQLATDLYRTYQVSHESVRLDLDVTVPPLPIDVAIPCGLLLNEMLSNCLKHAFTGRTAGRIGVAFRRTVGGNVALSVSDDGTGFPPGSDFRTTDSFGLQLIHTLAEQLNGRADLMTGDGATVTVTFPAPKETSR